MLSRNAPEREAAREHARLLITNSLSKDINNAQSDTTDRHIAGLHDALITALEPCLERLAKIAETMNGNTNLSTGQPWLSKLKTSLYHFLVNAFALKVAVTAVDHSFHWALCCSTLDLTSMTPKHFPANPGKHQVALTVFPGLSVGLLGKKTSEDAVKHRIVATTQVISCHKAD